MATIPTENNLSLDACKKYVPGIIIAVVIRNNNREASGSM